MERKEKVLERVIEYWLGLYEIIDLPNRKCIEVSSRR
jgi:hypothetical protein